MSRCPQPTENAIGRNRTLSPLVLEGDELVMEQMRQLGLSHFIVASSMEMPHDTKGGLPGRD